MAAGLEAEEAGRAGCRGVADLARSEPGRLYDAVDAGRRGETARNELRVRAWGGGDAGRLAGAPPRSGVLGNMLEGTETFIAPPSWGTGCRGARSSQEPEHVIPFYRASR